MTSGRPAARLTLLSAGVALGLVAVAAFDLVGFAEGGLRGFFWAEAPKQRP